MPASFYFYDMSYLNIEIKARCSKPGFVREWLNSHQAVFKGTDHQTDSYFQVKEGRLKLREGNIENNLIYYRRANQEGPKASSFELLPVSDPAKMKAILVAALGVKVVVEKKREIYFIDNVKFHIDEVPGLGHFVEIEAGNLTRDLDRSTLEAQCAHYMQMLNIQQQDLIDRSYSDMLGASD